MAYLLSQLLTESVARFPGLPAMRCGDTSLSYAELDALSGKMATALCENSIEVGDRVGIFMPKSVGSIAAIFAILKAGAVYVPIDWFAPIDRLAFIVKNCSMRALVSTTAGLDKISSTKSSVEPVVPFCLSLDSQPGQGSYSSVANSLAFREDIEGKKQMAPVTAEIIDKDLAYILYTSGSTGSPKGVMLSHQNALTFVNMAVDFFGITSNDTLVSHAPLHFDLSVFDVFCAIKAGGCVALLTEKEVAFPAAVLAAITKHRISVWNSVPSALIQLVQRTSLDSSVLSSLRLILFAGELFPAKYLRILMQKLPNAMFYNMYGQTEANSSTWYKVESMPELDGPPLPIGKPFPNYDVFALDGSGAIVSNPGTIGELYVRGTTVALGYWQDADKTSSNFVVNPLHSECPEIVYKTGDIVTRDENGNYVYIGRNDNMVKSRGFRIDLGEIESTLSNFSGVAQAAVVAVPDDELGNRIIGFVVPEIDKTISINELKEFCIYKIPRYMVPETFLIKTGFPKTSTGKVDRKMLLQDCLSPASLKPSDGLAQHA